MNKVVTPKSINILICEDNLGDVYIITNALQDSTKNYTIDRVSDGEAAIAYLQKTGEYINVPRPDLILLDLNLPKLHGFEVLSEIKKDPNLKIIPVIILTSSKSQQDIIRTYELFGSCFVTKPFDIEEFRNAIKHIEEFWLDLVKLPSKSISNG